MKSFILKRVVTRKESLPPEIPVTLDGAVLQRFNQEPRVKGTIELRNIREKVEATVTYGIVRVNGIVRDNGELLGGRLRMFGGKVPQYLKAGSKVYLGPAGIYEIQEKSI